VVREHQELVFISREGMVQRTGVRGISRYGRLSQGVRVMNIRDDDVVSAVALVMESEPEVAAEAAEDFVPQGDASTAAEGNGGGPTDTDGAVPDESPDDE
jgi:DNA gyrase subunit A